MSVTQSVHLNFPTYIKQNEHLLLPPVCNKMIHNDGKLRVMIVGGPNIRKDYHINQGEELFYMLRGDMCLKIMEQGQPKDVHIKEGEIFNLPASIPHSPQRFPDTIGLVIERMRPTAQLDGLRYYVDDTNEKTLWQRYFHSTDLGKELKPLIEGFFASEEFNTRVPAPDMPARAFNDNVTDATQAPFLLQSRIDTLLKKRSDEEAAGGGAAGAGAQPPLLLFSPDMEFKVFLCTQGYPTVIENECWIWQLQGSSKVNGETILAATDTYLCGRLESWECAADSVALLVYTDGC